MKNLEHKGTQRKWKIREAAIVDTSALTEMAQDTTTTLTNFYTATSNYINAFN